MQSTATTHPGSIFEAMCPDCGAPLVPDIAWIWRCGRCGRRYERCGLHLVAVAVTEQNKEVVSS